MLFILIKILRYFSLIECNANKLSNYQCRESGDLLAGKSELLMEEISLQYQSLTIL